MHRLFSTLVLLQACTSAPVGKGSGAVGPLPDPELDGDADADGLSDQEELRIGSDPEDPDSDGDSYLDPWEVREGTDPVDDDSRIYRGGWPYHPDKDSLGFGGWEANAWPGERFPRFVGVEQHGDIFELYDLAGEVPVVVEIAAAWCPICIELDAWLSGRPDGWYDSQYPGVPELLKEGRIRWVTVLAESSEGRPADASAAAAWAAAFPDLGVPVVADDRWKITDWLFAWGYPTLVLLEPDMTIRVYDEGDGYDLVLRHLSQMAEAR